MQGDEFFTAASQAPSVSRLSPPHCLLRSGGRLVTKKGNEVALLKSHNGDDCGVSTEITRGQVEESSTLSPNKLDFGDSA
jgi:hypothetical protein